MSLKVEKLSDNVTPNLNTVKTVLALSLTKISATTNKALSIVGCYFRGEKNPPEEWINTFCAVYCLNKDWLINGKGEPVFTGKPALSVVLKSSQNAGARVRAVRKKAKLTQTEFGKRLGLSRVGVYSIERNSTNLTPFSAAKIEEEFNVGADWLMFGDEDKKDNPVSEKLIKWLWTKPEVRARLWEEMERDS